MIRPAVLALLLSPSIAVGADPVRLATFNIHHAEGSDGVLDLKRVADVVRGADVIALQEVDVRFGARSEFVDQAARLAEELGGQYAFGGNLVMGEGRYGVALVSKFPITSSRNHRLPHSPGREAAEPRGVLEVDLDVRGRPLRVFVTHLAHDSKADRLLQVVRLGQVVGGDGGDPRAGAKPATPWILMGDLNFRPDSEEYARLVGPGEGSPKSDRPARFVDSWAVVGRGDGPTIGLRGGRPARIDYVLVAPELAPGLASARIDTETVASDHQPVFVELRFPPPGP